MKRNAKDFFEGGRVHDTIATLIPTGSNLQCMYLQ